MKSLFPFVLVAVSSMLVDAQTVYSTKEGDIIDFTAANGDATGAGVLGSNSDEAWNRLAGDDGDSTYGYGSDGNGGDVMGNFDFANDTAATGITYGIYNFDGQNGGPSSNDPSNNFDKGLFQGYSHINGGSHTSAGGSKPDPYIEYTGLNPNLTYDFVVYSSNNNGGRGFEATVDGISAILDTNQGGYDAFTSDPVSTVNGVTTYDGNYLEFDDVRAEANGDLIISLAGDVNTGEEDVVGTQLEATPEPGINAMMAVGLAMLAFLGYRRRAVFAAIR